MCDFFFSMEANLSYFLSYILKIRIPLRITDCDLSLINGKHSVNNGLLSIRYGLSLFIRVIVSTLFIELCWYQCLRMHPSVVYSADLINGY